MVEHDDTDPEGGDDANDTTGGAAVSRRSLMKSVGAAGMSVPLLTSRASATGLKHADSFGTVINMVDEGADPDGEEPIDDVLEDVMEDDALLYFPHGRYRMTRRQRFTDFDNFGLYGDDAWFVPDSYGSFDDRGGTYWLFRLGTGENPGGRLVIDDLHVDQTAPQTGVRAFDAVVSDELFVHDIDIHGTDDLGSEGPARFGITDPDGKGTVEKFWALDGAAPRHTTPNQENMYMGSTGIMANWPNKGTLRFKDCRLYEFSSTGLYACYGAGDTGRILVDGGVYRNNETAQIRVGSNNAMVKNVYVGVDDRRDDYVQQRGIRVEAGSGTTRVWDSTIDVSEPNGYALNAQDGTEDLHVRRCDIRMSGDRAAHALNIDGSTGAALVDNTTIRNDTPGGFGVWVEESSEDGTVVLEQSEIVGTAGGENGSAGIRNDRDGVEFRAITVDQTSDYGNRNAIVNLGDDTLYYKVTTQAQSHPIAHYGTGGRLINTYANSYSDNEGLYVDGDARNTDIDTCTIVGGVLDESGDVDVSGLATST